MNGHPAARDGDGRKNPSSLALSAVADPTCSCRLVLPQSPAADPDAAKPFIPAETAPGRSLAEARAFFDPIITITLILLTLTAFHPLFVYT